MSFSSRNLTHFDVSRIPLIPLEDIKQATNNFAQENIIQRKKILSDEFDWTVYKGELSGQKLAFISIHSDILAFIRRYISRRYNRDLDLRLFNELTKHQNIVSLIGICDEDYCNNILVLEHLTRGGLDKHVTGAHLTWLMRLQICLDIASGVHHLQTHDFEIKYLKSEFIHLDENWQAKIQFISPSALIYALTTAQLGYVDPSNFQGGKQSEIYSFGVILFELLCARPAVTYDEEGGTQFLSKLARSHYEKGTLIELIDPLLRVQMNRDCFTVFSELAYRCLSEDRPTIWVVIEQLQKVLKLQQGFEISELQQVQNIQHMKIPLKEIRSATRDLTIPHKPGKVYKAVLSHFNVDKYVAENKIKRVSTEEILEYPRRKSTVAVKSIDGGYGQRTQELLQTLLYRSHKNLVKLVGFCDEDDGRIHVVYEYASNGSLDEYIQSQHIIKRHKTERNMFPWVMRLQFCLEAARGLNFLHNCNRKNDTIIHGNIKSSNILISRDGVGMIGDFGLSTNDKLTKEYDVYSFGLVLFEVLSGALTHFKISEDDPKILPDIVKRGFNQEELDNIIDPMLRHEFEKYRSLIGNRSAESLNMFAKIAYQCFQEKAKGRPTMADIVEELEKAYKYHVESLEQMLEDEDNSKMENLKHLKIPFKEIYSATNGFVDSRMIGWGGFGGVYRAELFHVDVRKYVGKKESLVELYGYPRRKGEVALKRREIMSDQGRKEFWKEIDVLSGLNHQNIISLVGFCYEYGEMIIIYDYASNGSFEKYIRNFQNLKWEQRLQICIDAAQGLNYLHNHHIIHRDVKSPNILLGDSLEGMIGGVGLSLTVKNTDSQLSKIIPAGTVGYVDPKYLKTGILSKQSDMYSFGVVLLEVLCGRFEEGGTQSLSKLACSHYEKGTLIEFIDPLLRVQMNRDCFTVFSELAYRCLNKDPSIRPTISVVIEQLLKVLKLQQGSVTSELQQVQNIPHMKIPLDEIRSATCDFTILHKTGKVYKAELSHFDVDRYLAENKIGRVSMEEILEYPRRKSTVAIKSIYGGYGERTEELLQTLLCLSHENLVKLVGFCDEDDGCIHVVYEYASNGSLDEYIHSQHINYRNYTNNPTRETMRNIFPWVMRLQFCLEAARGLNFLHNGNRKNGTIIHGNIKSSNILISRDGVGMIGDFGFSTNEYSDIHKLTKEYDVYSFGLVLFEVLSGALTHFKISEDDRKFLPDIVKRGFIQKELDNIIDPMLRHEFEKYRSHRSHRSHHSHRSLIGNRSAESLNMFAKIAYQCFQEKAKGRPTMADIVEELEKAYKYHVESLEQRQEDEDNSKMENLKHLKIPFKEIYSATNGFVDSRMIGWGGFGGVYRAELFHVDVRKYVGKKESLVELYGYPRRKGKVALKRREIMSDQGRKEFWKEIDVLSGLNHQNIISLVGFCYEYGEMIIIYDYASNGSFEKYIRNVQNLKWEKRLQICIDVAQGLNYLHNHHIIHRDVKSGNILLGDSLEGMIGDVGLSLTVKNTDCQLSNTTLVGTPGYVDPNYLKRGILSKQSDMYSFGVVLLEVLCGRFANNRASLVNMAECHLSNNQPSQIIGDYLRKYLEDEKFLDSVKIFAAITHECLHSTDGDETRRLTMADVLKELKKALTVHVIGSETISLEEIKSATNHFSKERVIGSGASGKIYKGELSFSKKSIPVAVKRLDRAHSYGEGAFLKEVVKLSRYVHENIITLRGFCEEDDEKIIIMDHASNESLDRHLDKSILTWEIRLKISIGAAKGLNHIHSFEEDQNTVHGDIKSNHVLLDQDWKASISDFILSKTHGTKGYLDPQHVRSSSRKETDVYSFGVVLFEILSGKLAIEKAEKYSHHTLRQIINDERERSAGDGAEDKEVVSLAWMAARCFEENKLEALIFDNLTEQTDAKSIEVVSKVAYQCLHKAQEERPTMAFIIQELEKALNIHVDWEFEQKLPKDNENIMKMIEHQESEEITKKDRYPIFSSGILLNNGKVWLSLNKDGKAKEMISATMFSYEKCWSSKWKVLDNSRFGAVAKISNTQNLKIPINIKTQFLSLGIIYGAYLVFKFCDPKIVSNKPYVDLKYKTASGKLNSYIAERRDGEWMMIELCRFRSDNQIFDFQVQLESLWGHPCGNGPIFIDGIEFRPIDNAAHEESVGRFMNAESSVNQDQQSPSDFQEIMKRSLYDVSTMTKQELDKLLSTIVLIDNGEKLFSLSKVNCKKCHMLPAKAVINKSPDAKFTKFPSSTMSRFEEVVELQHHRAFSIKCDIETKMLSPDTVYACYLVFQLPENSEGLKCPVKARDLLNKNNKEETIIYLRAPGPIDLYRDKRVPENREDGWMEVRVWEFVYNDEIKDIPMELKLVCLGGTMTCLTVCGVEFRPLGPC